MKNKKNRNRLGKPAEIGKLDFFSWTGQLVDRTKAKVTEKRRGLFMIDNIMNRFSISKNEMLDYFKKEEMLELKEVKEMINNPDKTKVFENLSKDKLEKIKNPLRPWKM